MPMNLDGTPLTEGVKSPWVTVVLDSRKLKDRGYIDMLQTVGFRVYR